MIFKPSFPIILFLSRTIEKTANVLRKFCSRIGTKSSMTSKVILNYFFKVFLSYDTTVSVYTCCNYWFGTRHGLQSDAPGPSNDISGRIRVLNMCHGRTNHNCCAT